MRLPGGEPVRTVPYNEIRTGPHLGVRPCPVTDPSGPVRPLWPDGFHPVHSLAGNMRGPAAARTVTHPLIG